MSEIIINEVVTTVDLTVTEIITTQTIVINEAVGILEVVAGANVTVDNTNPLRPVVSAIGGGGGGGSWGSITGTISDQIDLQSALDDKLDVDATTADIAPSTNRNYQTDLQNMYNDATSSIQGQIDAIASPYLGSIVPSSTPTGTGAAYWTATQAGTYTNFGGVVVNANSLATISRSATGVFSISQTTIDLTEIEEKLDLVVEKTNNLADKTTLTFGQYHPTTGIPSASTNWLRLLPITVDGVFFEIGEVYTISGFQKFSTSADRVIFIRSDNSVISSVKGTGTSSISPTFQNFTIPPETDRLLIHVASGAGVGLDIPNSPYYETIQINKGSSVLKYEPFGFKPKLNPKTIYIALDGDDNNDGLSYENPILTFDKAKEILDEDGTLIFKGGDYDNFDLDLSIFKRIKSADGEKARFIYGTKINSATSTVGRINVYEAPYVHTGTWVESYQLWHHNIADERSLIDINYRNAIHNGRTHRLDSTKLRWVASIDLVESSLIPCYYYNGTTIYFKTQDDLPIDSTNPLIVPNVVALPNFQKKYVEHSNFEILYRHIRTKGLEGYFNRVSCLYNNSPGSFITDDTINLTFNKCRAGGGSNDGFNGHSYVTHTDLFTNYTDVKLNNCWSHDHFDDAESHHEYCQVEVNGGVFEYSGNGCTPAIGCHTTYNSVIIQKCLDYGLSGQGSPIDGGEGTDVSAYNCYSVGNRVNYRATATSVGSLFFNCVSSNPIDTHFEGTSSKINCVEIP